MSNCGLSKSYTGTLHFLTLHGCSSTMKIGGTGKEEEKGPKGQNKLLLNFDTLGKNVKKKLRLSIVNFSTLAICNAKKLANFYQRAFWLYLPWEFRSRLFFVGTRFWRVFSSVDTRLYPSVTNVTFYLEWLYDKKVYSQTRHEQSF